MTLSYIRLSFPELLAVAAKDVAENAVVVTTEAVKQRR